MTNITSRAVRIDQNGGPEQLKIDQHRALGMDGVAACDAHRAQLVSGTRAASNEFAHGSFSLES